MPCSCESYSLQQCSKAGRAGGHRPSSKRASMASAGSLETRWLTWKAITGASRRFPTRTHASGSCRSLSITTPGATTTASPNLVTCVRLSCQLRDSPSWFREKGQICLVPTVPTILGHAFSSRLRFLFIVLSICENITKFHVIFWKFFGTVSLGKVTAR